MEIIDTNGPKECTFANFPQDPDPLTRGTRKVTIQNKIYIEKSDFRTLENGGGNKKYFGLAPGKLVRLKFAFHVECIDVVFKGENESGENNVISKIICKRVDNPAKKAKGTIHWVSAEPGEFNTGEVRLYKRLFKSDDCGGSNWFEDVNRESETICPNAVFEKAGTSEEHAVKPFDRVQFERVGYFCADIESSPEKMIFNQTIGLRDGR